MTYRAIFVIIAVFVFFPIAQMRAEVKEPFAVVELGAATERSFQEGTYSIGPSASVEFPVIKDWLEIETGISPLFRPGIGKPIFSSRSRSQSTSMSSL
jgi:hypothetical protein